MRSEGVARAAVREQAVRSHPAIWTRYRVWLPYAYLFLCAVLATVGYGSGNIIGEGAADLHVAPVRFIQSLAFTWDSRMYLGNHNGFTQVYLTPYSWLYALGEMMRLNPELVQRIVLFLIYAWIAGAAYWALKYIAPGISVLGRLCCATAYLFNIYVAFNSNGAVAMLLTYASTPLIIGTLAAVMAGEWNVVAGAIAIAAAVFFGSGNNPPLIVINVAVAACYLVVRIVLSRNRLQQIRKAAAISVLASFASLLLNLYWIVPFVDYIRTVWLPGLLDESPAMHNLDSSFSHVLLGFGQWGIFQGDVSGPWYAWAHAYTHGAFVFAFWLIVICAFATPLFRRARTDATAFFFALAAISIPCAVGYYSGPIGPAITSKIYDFFYNDVPGFQMFRSSYKLVWPYEFAVAGLLGIFADNVYVAIRERLRARSLRVAYGVLGLILVLPAFAYLPVIVFKANYAMPPLPDWILQEGRVAGTDQNSRVALFPSQYLEQFIWGRPWYYLEHGVFQRPVTFGYLGGASNQSADEWLRFAYQRVREGDPSALDAFRVLSTSTILQRDDFRSDIDFSFPALGVSANTTLSHDMISRILGANQYARVGASRFYHIAGALPIVYGVAHAQIGNGPAMSVPQSTDVEAIAKGRAVVNADRVSVSAIREAVADGLIGSRDKDSIRDLSTTSMYRVSPHLEIQRPGQSVWLPAAGWYRVVAAQKDPAQDEPLGPIGVDSKRILPDLRTSGDWTYYGLRYLRAGPHAVSADGAGYVTPILVAFIPEQGWQQRFDALSALIRESKADSFTVPVHSGSTTIHIADAGTYRISGRPQRVLSPDFRSEDVGIPETSAPQIQVRTRKSPAGGRIALPYVPAEGVVPTWPEPLPMSWLAQAQTYDWSRGAAVTWWMLKRAASFYFSAPENASSQAQLHLRLSNIGPHPHLLNLYLNGQKLRQVQLPSGNAVGSGARAALAAYVSYPIDVSIPLSAVRRGMNRLAIVSDLLPGVPAKRISDAIVAGQDDVVAAVAPDMSLTVKSTAGVIKFPASQRVAVVREPSLTEISLAGSGASASFALLPLPLTSTSLNGDPFLVGALHAALPRGSHAWISEMACNDVSGATQYRTWPIVPGNAAFDLALAHSLTNSQSDGTQRLCGLWLALSLDHAVRGDALLPHVVLQPLSILRWLWPENVVATSSLGATQPAAQRQGENLLFTFPRHVRARDVRIALPAHIPGRRDYALLQFVAFAKNVNFRMSLEGLTANGWRLMGTTTTLTRPVISRDGGNLRYHYRFPATRFLAGDPEQAPWRYELVADGRVFRPAKGIPKPGEFRCQFQYRSGVIKAIDVSVPGAVEPQNVQLTEVPATWWADYGTLKVLSVSRLALQSISARASQLRLVVSIIGKQRMSTSRSIIISPPRFMGSIGTEGIQRVPLLVDGKRTAGTVHLSKGDHHIASALRYENIATLAVQSANLPPAKVLPLHADRTSPVSLDVSTDRPLSPFLLVFGESYHPHWKAFLNGEELTHIEANGYANGWLVPGLRPGDRITVRFTEQRWFVFAVWISVLSGLGFLAYIGLSNLRWRRAA